MFGIKKEIFSPNHDMNRFMLILQLSLSIFTTQENVYRKSAEHPILAYREVLEYLTRIAATVHNHSKENTSPSTVTDIRGKN